MIGSRRRRSAWLGLVLAAFVFVVSFHAFAQRGSHMPISRARVVFEELDQASLALDALHPQPADADGAVATWDRRWAHRVASLRRETRSACRDGQASDCTAHERYALLCNTAANIETHRRVIYSDLPESDERGEADRRAIADEAARRRAASLSCEDLPSWIEVRREDGVWVRSDGTPLTPGAVGAVPERTAGFDPPLPATPDVTVLPATPSRASVTTAMDDMTPVVIACGDGEHGVALVAISVSGATGQVSAATVGGQFAGTPVGECIAVAVRGASFPPFRQATFSFSYPFRI